MGNNSKMEIWLECPMCRREHTVEVERADFIKKKKETNKTRNYPRSIINIQRH